MATVEELGEGRIEEGEGRMTTLRDALEKYIIDYANTKCKHVDCVICIEQEKKKQELLALAGECDKKGKERNATT